MMASMAAARISRSRAMCSGTHASATRTSTRVRLPAVVAGLDAGEVPLGGREVRGLVGEVDADDSLRRGRGGHSDPSPESM
jgi:hypothetical protein